MARTPAGFPGGVRRSDYLTVNDIAQVYPHDTVREELRLTDSDSRRRRDLPAEVTVYYVIAMVFFRTVSAREGLQCLVNGLRLSSQELALKVSGKSSISRARDRLGLQPLADQGLDLLCQSGPNVVACVKLTAVVARLV